MLLVLPCLKLSRKLQKLVNSFLNLNMRFSLPQICNLICFPSIVIIRAPNSTPIVRSWTGWNLLSVNWSNKQDFPTPKKNKYKSKRLNWVKFFAYQSIIIINNDDLAWEFEQIELEFNVCQKKIKLYQCKIKM